MKRLNLTGKKFGRLLVLGPAGSSERGESLWRCRCDCGNDKVFVGIAICYKRSKIKSCGCMYKEVCQERGRLAVKRKQLLQGRAIPGAAFRGLLSGYKANAKKRGMDWRLSDEDFRRMTQSPCFYTGRYPSNISKAASGEIYVYNGIDRLDNSKGYTLENSVPCCAVVNKMKMDLPFDEFMYLCRVIVRHEQKRRKGIEQFRMF